MTLGDTKICYDIDVFAVSVGSEGYETGNGRKMVYYIDFKPYEKLPEKFEIEIKI